MNIHFKYLYTKQVKSDLIFEGKVISKELSFTNEAKIRINRWKVEVSNAAYSATDSDAIRALCGKLETYLIRFSLIVHIMRGICDGVSMESIDLESAERAILLTEYFRSMESRISPEFETGVLDPRYTDLLNILDDCFSTNEIVKAGLRLGISRSSIFRFLKDGGRGFITKDYERGAWTIFQNRKQEVRL